MAQKRMFDKGLLETDAFMDMPMPTKALYFLLGMEADDEGFVSPKRVMRLYGGNDDDLKVLIAKGFVIQFKSGVVVITDWKENNYLDKNRIKETVYQAEKKLLALSSNKYHLLNSRLTDVDPEENSIEENRREEKRIVANPSDSQGIANIIDLFKAVNPSYGKLFGNTTQRAAAKRLSKLFPFNELVVLITEVLPEYNAQRYAKGKSITPLQFEDNLGHIKSWFDQKNKEKEARKVIRLD